MLLSLNLPNLLSLSRGFLAFFLPIENPMWRTWIILLAMITDGLDGYLARTLNQRTQLGAILDPLMDKLFAAVAIAVFIAENKLDSWQALSLLSRDLSVIAFGLYLIYSQRLKGFHFESIWMGKLTTLLQFLVLISLVHHVPIPNEIFNLFVVIGALALLELSLFKIPKTPLL